MTPIKAFLFGGYCYRHSPVPLYFVKEEVMLNNMRMVYPYKVIEHCWGQYIYTRDFSFILISEDIEKQHVWVGYFILFHEITHHKIRMWERENSLNYYIAHQLKPMEECLCDLMGYALCLKQVLTDYYTTW